MYKRQDLNGNLYDIKVSGIISNTEVTIKENKDDVLFKTKGTSVRNSHTATNSG